MGSSASHLPIGEEALSRHRKQSFRRQKGLGTGNGPHLDFCKLLGAAALLYTTIVHPDLTQPVWTIHGFSEWSHMSKICLLKSFNTFCLPSLITFPAPLGFPLWSGLLVLCFYIQSHDQIPSVSYKLLQQINVTHLHLEAPEQTCQQLLLEHRCIIIKVQKLETFYNSFSRGGGGGKSLLLNIFWIVGKLTLYLLVSHSYHILWPPREMSSHKHAAGTTGWQRNTITYLLVWLQPGYLTE